eukprot:288659-Rhodomonas_salina.2
MAVPLPSMAHSPPSMAQTLPFMRATLLFMAVTLLFAGAAGGMGAAFEPYLDRCLESIGALSNYFHE